MTISVRTSADLALEAIGQIAFGGAQVALAPEALERGKLPERGP
jgi:hypothetical protein